MLSLLDVWELLHTRGPSDLAQSLPDICFVGLILFHDDSMPMEVSQLCRAVQRSAPILWAEHGFMNFQPSLTKQLSMDLTLSCFA